MLVSTTLNNFIIQDKLNRIEDQNLEIKTSLKRLDTLLPQLEHDIFRIKAERR